MNVDLSAIFNETRDKSNETDKKIEHFYLKTLKKMHMGLDNNRFTRSMGRLGSVTETKKYLEKIYKLQPPLNPWQS